MRKLLVGVVVLGLASMALADPTVGYTVADVGGGLYGVTFTVYGNDGLQLSFFADMTFDGEDGAVIQQIDPMGNPNFAVNSEQDADSWDGTGGYVKVADSWYGNPFGVSPPASIVALTEGVNTYHIEAGTGGGSAFEEAKLAYIASTAGRLHYYGYVSRTGSSFPVDDYAIVPEPATLMLVLAGAGLALRRRRR